MAKRAKAAGVHRVTWIEPLEGYGVYEIYVEEVVGHMNTHYHQIRKHAKDELHAYQMGVEWINDQEWLA